MSDQDTQALVVRPQTVAMSGYVPPPDKSEFEAMISMANTLAKAQGFLPAHFFGQPYKILAAILYGRDLGISATNALQHIIVIEGKATADAQLIGMLVRRAGHQMVDTTTDQSSTVKITRSDGTVHEATFTMQDAQRAGLVRAGGAWTKYPAAMLYARALTACARKGAQDALMGTIYTPEELGAEVDSNGAAILPPSAPTGEIPTSQASPETVAALKEAASSDQRQSSGLDSPPAAIQEPAAAVTSPPPSTRSVGPRAKRQNVVTAPQAQPTPSVAPVAAVTVPGLSDDPLAGPTPLQDEIAKMQAKVEELKAKARERDGKSLNGEAEYLATLRQTTRESAGLLRQYRIRLKNLEGGEPIPLPEAKPSADSDESLAVFIDSQFRGKTLDTLGVGELEKISKALDEIITRVQAKFK